MKHFRHTLFAATAAVGMAMTAPALAEPVAIVHATIIDGTGRAPIPNGTIVIDNGRIVSVGAASSVKVPKDAKIIDEKGKFIIPGLMDANVHLYLNLDTESLIRYEGRYDEIVKEGAQITLKNGLTTVFDTWGPYDALQQVRDEINSGATVGSRIYFAGNIIGFDGPLSADFRDSLVPMVSKDFVKRINVQWEKGTGRGLMWDSPQEVGKKISDYANGAVDFLKYGGSGHKDEVFITFSPRVQREIVNAAHKAGKTVQVHAIGLESADMAIDAGVDIITHCDITSSIKTMPLEIIQKMVDKNVYCSILPVTDALRTALLAQKNNGMGKDMANSRINIQNMQKAGVQMMLSTDAGVQNPIGAAESEMPQMDPRTKLGEGHFNAMLGLEQMGVPAMDILKISTINIARGYHLDKDIGSLEPGKRADLVILKENPLASARNYRTITTVMKDGQIVDRAALPSAPVISILKPSASDTAE
jgi:imidazolonepropionase-like amidohydrolase